MSSAPREKVEAASQVFIPADSRVNELLTGLRRFFYVHETFIPADSGVNELYTKGILLEARSVFIPADSGVNELMIGEIYHA